MPPELLPPGAVDAAKAIGQAQSIQQLLGIIVVVLFLMLGYVTKQWLSERQSRTEDLAKMMASAVTPLASEMQNIRADMRAITDKLVAFAGETVQTIAAVKRTQQP